MGVANGASVAQRRLRPREVARGDSDERHICPLQLGLIRRAVAIWSLPNEVVFSPFAGVGSEGVGAIDIGRKFVGIELKPEYYEQAIVNLDESVAKKANTRKTRTLFDLTPDSFDLAAN